MFVAKPLETIFQFDLPCVVITDGNEVLPRDGRIVQCAAYSPADHAVCDH